MKEITVDENSFKLELVKYLWKIVCDATELEDSQVKEIHGDLPVVDYTDDIVAMVKKHFSVSKTESVKEPPFSKEELNTIISVMSLIDDDTLNKFEHFKSVEAKLVGMQKVLEEVTNEKKK